MRKQKAFSILFIAAVLALLAGCSAAFSVQELPAKLQQLLLQLAKGTVPGITHAARAQSLLSLGLDQYERGEYLESERSLQFALARGLPAREQVLAHKHLAFIHCAAERKPECRDEFRHALRADPAMKLDPAEAGHPTWGPVFASLFAER